MRESSPFCHLLLLPLENFSPCALKLFLPCLPAIYPLINFPLIKSIEPPHSRTSLSLFLLCLDWSNLIFVVGHIFRREFCPRLPCPPHSVCPAPGQFVPLSITSDHRNVQIVQTAPKGEFTFVWISVKNAIDAARFFTSI